MKVLILIGALFGFLGSLCIGAYEAGDVWYSAAAAVVGGALAPLTARLGLNVNPPDDNRGSRV